MRELGYVGCRYVDGVCATPDPGVLQDQVQAIRRLESENCPGGGRAEIMHHQGRGGSKALNTESRSH